ncbi:MAG: hypothetical protein ABIK89_07625 [Planctomycetota bacterium]
MTARNLWNALGPGILLAAASVGASHLVLSPQAGARFGYQLLWLVVASHLFKYRAFEFGPRYAAPVLYGLNLYCVLYHVEDPRLRPAALSVAIAWAGIAFMLIALGATVYVKLLLP